MRRLFIVCFVFMYMGLSETYPLVNSSGIYKGSISKIDDSLISLKTIFTNDVRAEQEFVNAINNSITYYKRVSAADNIYIYGKERYSPKEMVASLEMFKRLIAKPISYDAFLSQLGKNFDIYELKNQNDKAVLTGYFTPSIQASLVRTDTYRYPIFVNSKPKYFTKHARDVGKLKLEGAGVLILPNGEKTVLHYDGTVGSGKYTKKKMKVKKVIKTKGGKKKFRWIGKTIRIPILVSTFNETKNMPMGSTSLPLISRYSAAVDREITPMGALMYVKTTSVLSQDEIEVDEEMIQDELDEIEDDENQNETTKTLEQIQSNVFETNPLANNNKHQTAGATSASSAISANKFENFMLAHDIGGAIKGGGRVDVYLGEGDRAEVESRMIKRYGSVYLIVAKKDKLADYFAK